MNDKLYKFDDGAALRFFYSTAKNNGQSERCGRPVFDRVLMVEVISPGSKDSIPHFEVRRWVNSGDNEAISGDPIVSTIKENKTLVERYARQLEAFLGDRDDPNMMGTALEAWPGIDVETIAALKEARIYTVEGLANLSEGKFSSVGPGARSLVARAKAFLEAAKGNAPFEAQATVIANLQEEVERLTGMVKDIGSSEELVARIKELEEENASLKLDMELAGKDEQTEEAPKRGRRSV